ncbi:MAG: DUF72 domain-containing protein [Gammaproteobacteria bacterium]|nr:MAG: DUF72 domain-containing protein [Gammaproteobacteria bacterium]
MGGRRGSGLSGQVKARESGPRSRVRVGTCGFAESRGRIFADFDLIEVQQTFYQPPREETALRWREEAPRDFFFTLKAWQLITHERSSPTYRRLREPLSEADLSRAGAFRWNAVTRMAWRRTLGIARALRARAVLFQTPPSFLPTPGHLRNLRRFFEAAERDGLRLVFEPRGEAWTPAVLRPLLSDLGLLHGVDPFLTRPVGRGLRYFRLHGRPAWNYGYRYSDEDLLELKGRLNLAWGSWVLFNNASMAQDARRFIRLLERAEAGSG